MRAEGISLSLLPLPRSVPRRPPGPSAAGPAPGPQSPPLSLPRKRKWSCTTSSPSPSNWTRTTAPSLGRGLQLLKRQRAERTVLRDREHTYRPSSTSPSSTQTVISRPAARRAQHTADPRTRPTGPAPAPRAPRQQHCRLRSPAWGGVCAGSFSFCPLERELFTVNLCLISSDFFNRLVVFLPTPSCEGHHVGRLVPCAPSQAHTQSDQAEFCMYLLMLVTFN